MRHSAGKAQGTASPISLPLWLEVITQDNPHCLRYWEAFRKVVPESFDFHGRMTTTHQNNASDPVNLALNYAYGVLEGECRRAINTIGLEPSVGFLHDFSNYQTKQSLVYDLMEPFRWLADTSVLSAIECEALDLPDFYFTGDDYRYHLNKDAKQRLIEVMRENCNAGAIYQGRTLKRDIIIECKANELGRYVAGKSSGLDLVQPAPTLETNCDGEIRRKILELDASKAKRLEIGKGTLHYLHKKAQNPRPFKLSGKVQRKLGLS